MKKFQLFRLNFSWDISKTRYFSNKFSRIAKRWRRNLPSILVTWSCLICPIVFFKLVMMKSSCKNQLWRHFGDAIVISSPKHVTN